MGIVDWIVVALYAAAMLAIGRHYGRKNKTAEDYHLGGRRMSPFAVGLSLFATLTSALSYLAVPGEMVKNGPMVLAQLVAYPLIALVVGWGLIPFIMQQSVTSAYEILERRFGVSVRLVGSTMFLAMRLGWMATILYATSDKVLSPLLGLGPLATTGAALVMCVITLIYTAEGGLRAVIVTDAMQSVIMLAGATAVIAIVSVDLGGVSAWWPSLARALGRAAIRLRLVDSHHVSRHGNVGLRVVRLYLRLRPNGDPTLAVHARCGFGPAVSVHDAVCGNHGERAVGIGRPGDGRLFHCTPRTVHG